MRINVGSKNNTKVKSVENACKGSVMFRDAEIFPFDVKVETFGHPIGMEKTVHGAKDRALQSFHDCDYSVGIEGGLVEVPGSKSGYLEFGVCAIYDGKNYHLGFSPGYEWPSAVTDLIVNKGFDGSSAMREAGLTDQEKIGINQGAVGLLTSGRIDRTKFNELAVIMALIHLENREHYK